MSESHLYRPEDEVNHDFAGIENFNESMAAHFFDPVSRIAGMVRVANRPTLGYAEASVNLYLPDGTLAFRAGRRPSTTNEGFESQGLRFRVDTPGEALSVTYANDVAHLATPSLLASNARRTLKSSPSEECEIDLNWQGRSPLFALDHSGAGSPGSSIVASDHYEQFGRWAGTVRVGSHAWDLRDVCGWRDHSWGAREWGSYYGETLMLYLSDGSSLMAYSELEEDGSRSVTGSAYVGGELRPIVDFQAFTDYTGGPRIEGRYRAVVEIEGAPPIPLEGTIHHFVPLTMATGDRGVRLAQLSVTFAGSSGACGYAEYLRPIEA